MSRYLPPKSVRLEEIVVPEKTRKTTTTSGLPELVHLRVFADAMGSEAMRRSFSRPYTRERQVTELAQLLGRERANVLLVGDTGVDKTSVLVEAVRQVEREMREWAKAAGNQGDEASQKIWLTSAGRLIAGMKYLGQWQERCEQGLNDPNRPLGVLLFTGPTGVGKTELARTLARFFFGEAELSERFVRLDMSEYSLPGSAERLIAGANGEPSEFINRMRRQPLAVVLLDEIEKADEGVFDVLLSVFDEGRLTDRCCGDYFDGWVPLLTAATTSGGRRRRLGRLYRHSAFDSEEHARDRAVVRS